MIKYRPEIDGLRSVAVLPVILFHAGIAGFSGGFVGVDIFFVISGFLITSILLSDIDAGKYSIVKFYERRARRIIPALAFMLIGATVAGYFILLPQEFKSFSYSVLSTITFSSNIFFWRSSGYFDTASDLKPLLHTWTLSLEEQFYLFFPILLHFARRLTRRTILVLTSSVAIVSFAYANNLVTKDSNTAFFWLHTRAWELLLGSCCALVISHQNIKKARDLISTPMELLGISSILYSVFSFTHETPFPSFYTLLPTIGTCLIILFSSETSLVGKILSTRIPVQIGLISYSAYLWHQPILALARNQSLTDLSAPQGLGLALLSLLIAFFSWKFVEAPFRSASRFSSKEIFTLTAASSLILGLLAISVALTNGFQHRFSTAVNKYNSQNSNEFWNQLRPCLDQLRQESSIARACRIGATTHPTQFILFGDSHAGAIAKELGDAVERNVPFSGINFTFNGCPPLPPNFTPKIRVPDDEVCLRVRQAFFESLSNPALSDIKTVVLYSRWPLLVDIERFDNLEGGHETGTPWIWTENGATPASQQAMIQSGLSETFRRISAAGKKILVIYPTPEMGWSIPNRLAKELAINGFLNASSASISQDVYAKRIADAKQILDALSTQYNATRFDPSLIFCKGGRCLAHFGGESLYVDDDHLSNVGARLISQELVPLLAITGKLD